MILHTESITPATLLLAERLGKIDILSSFYLGGGTSLALRFGHRRSIDLDLFSVEPFDSLLLQNSLAAIFPGMAVLNRTAGSLCASIGGIKLDILRHAYPLIDEVDETDVLDRMDDFSRFAA